MLKVHDNLSKGASGSMKLNLKTCHYKQAARGKYLGYNSLDCAGNMLVLYKVFCKSSLTDYCLHD